MGKYKLVALQLSSIGFKTDISFNVEMIGFKERRCKYKSSKKSWYVTFDAEEVDFSNIPSTRVHA